MEVFESKFQNLFEIPSKVHEVYWSPIISGYSVLQTFGSEFVTTLIVRDSPYSFYRIYLSGLINLQFSVKYCLRCFTPLSVSSDPYCSTCYSPSEIAYRNCLFHSPKSLYSRQCSVSNPACGDSTNVLTCFSQYYLYFGRFGNTIKVGISRLTQGKSKFARLIQQGLNEAIVVYPFSSLPEVTSFERFLIDDIGIQESINFQQKADSLLSYSYAKLFDYYSLNQIKELFPNSKVVHLELYADNPLEHILSSSFDVEVLPIVDSLVGNIIYTQGNVGVLKQYNKLVLFDISKLNGRVIKRGESW